MSTITFRNKKDGVLYDPSSIVLSASDSSYGVKRNDTDAVVVVDGTAMTKSATGVYTYTFTDPADDLTYTYSAEIVENAGETASFFAFQLDGPESAAEPTSDHRYSINTLASQLRGEFDVDDNASGGTIPARFKTAIRNSGIWLWNAWDWRFRRKIGTLSFASGASAAELPSDFAELDSKWIRETSDNSEYWFQFIEDPVRWQNLRERYDFSDSGQNGQPKWGTVLKDESETPWVWEVRFTPQADQAYSYRFMYLTADPWVSEDLSDASEVVWPVTFMYGWELLSRIRLYGMLKRDAEETTSARSEFREWFKGQKSENDETIATNDNTITGGHNDMALTASQGFYSGSMPWPH